MRLDSFGGAIGVRKHDIDVATGFNICAVNADIVLVLHLIVIVRVDKSERQHPLFL